MLGLLAILLQICATLFLSGPLISLWKSNPTIALLMFFLAATAVSAIAMFLPVSSSTCPDKSPLSETLGILASHTRCFSSRSGLCIYAWGFGLYERPKQITGRVEVAHVSTLAMEARRDPSWDRFDNRARLVIE
jgi:hypothetical protein